MEDRGRSEIDLLREELIELRAELEELKAEEEAAEEQEPKRPNLRLIQGGLLAGIGGWLWAHRAQAVVALAAGAVGSAAIVLMPHYSRPGDDMQLPVETPASTPERSRDLPDPRPRQPRATKTSDGPIRTGTKRPVPTRPSSAASKTPEDLVPSTAIPTAIPTSSVTIPTPVGTVAPTLRPTAPVDALADPTVPQPTAASSGACTATIVTICIPVKP